MGMRSNIPLSRMRKDLKYLLDTYGYVHDYCGGFCNTEVLVDILFGRRTIKDVIVENIECYFSKGIDSPYRNSSDTRPDMTDKAVRKIVDRYGIDLK